MTLFSKVYSRFLKKIEDPDLALYDEETQNAILKEYLETAIAFVEMEDIAIKNDLTDIDEDYECFNADLTVGEIEALALLMAAAWYEPKINSLEHTMIYVGTNTEKWDSKKNHYDMMVQTRDNYIEQARKHFVNYTAKHNDYLGR